MEAEKQRMSELAGGMKGPSPFIINSDIKPPLPNEEEDSHDMLIGWNRPKKNHRKVLKKRVSDNEEGNKSNLDAPTDTEQRVPLQKFID